VRPEWRGGGIRNANLSQYAELLAEVRDQFFIVSVADLMEGREWIVGPRLKADLELHEGVPFGTLAALFSLADVVYTSGGFGTLLAMAVETPVVSVLGGFEPASWANASARSPYLGIEPRVPCACGSSGCMKLCTKDLDLPLAVARLREFLSSICIQTSDTPRRSMNEMFDSPIRVSSLPLSHQQIQLQRAMLYGRASMGQRA
jgi:ADP-heptose:LPS heptosyltransferase